MSKNKEAMKVDTGRLRARGAVRLSIPASVAYDLKRLQKGLEIFAERLGHRACFSGVECTFLTERDFVINEKLEVNRVAAPASAKGLDPDGDPARTVSMSPGTTYDIKRIQNVVAKLAERGGHPQCYSGFDFRFRQEIDYLVNPAGEISAGRGF